MKNVVKRTMLGTILAGMGLCLLAPSISAHSKRQASALIPVPYHSQVPRAQWPQWGEPGNPAWPNNWCTVACLDMVFDYYDGMGHPNPPLPQQEIAACANTDDVGGTAPPPRRWAGTHRDDARRAAHFSSISQALTRPGDWQLPQGQRRPGNWGYTWRSLGYSTVDANWKNQNWAALQLKGLLNQGYPIIVHLDPDSVNAYKDSLKVLPGEGEYSPQYDSCFAVPTTASGHSVVLIGYDNHPARNWFVIHCPSWGRFLTCPQAIFWNKLWSGDFLFCAPWEFQRRAPFAAVRNSKFWIGERVSYTGPAPLRGWYPVWSPTATINLPPGFALPNNDPTHGLQWWQWWPPFIRGLTFTGTSHWTWWQVQAGNNPGWFTVDAKGRVSSSSTSYAGGYGDDLGGGDRFPIAIVWLVNSIGFRGGGFPWDDSGVYYSPSPPSPGEPTEIYAWVYNYGDEPATDIHLDLYYLDPEVCQHYPASSLAAIGSETVPSIPPGDSVLVGPVGFTPPSAGNSFGEPYFDVLGRVYCPGDTGSSGWLLEDDNLSCKSSWSVEGEAGVPQEMHFWVRNPIPEPAKAILELDKSRLPPEWAVELDPPEGDTIELPPLGSLPVALALIPSAIGGSGALQVVQCLSDWSGGFLTVTGGLSFQVTIGPVVEATADIHPEVLNLRSGGRWVTTYIELPSGYDPADIVVSTVALQYQGDFVSAELRPATVGDYDSDGIPDLMVKFNRGRVEEMFPRGFSGEAQLKVSGSLETGEYFEGADTIVVVSPGRGPQEEAVARAGTFSLFQNSPNPFSGRTSISFHLPQSSHTTLRVYDLSGRAVAKLVEGRVGAGLHTVTWETDGVPPGIYFYRLSGDGLSSTAKMVLMR